MKRHYALCNLSATLLITACGGSGAGDGPPPTYTVSGTISGLSSPGLTLTNNGSAPISIAANAKSFLFPGALGSSTAYHVTVANQPNDPPLYCAVSDGSGTVGQANVTGVQVTCVPYQVLGGGVANLVGSGLSLSVNGSAPLAISQSGPFTFPTQLPQGVAYNVKIVQQPTNPSQACVLVNGSGTVPTSNLSSIAVYCPRPLGRFAYVVNIGSVSLYAIDASTGALTAVGAPLATPAESLALGPNVLYVGYGYSKCVKDCIGRHPFDGSSRRATDKAEIEYFGVIDVYPRDAETGVLSSSAVQTYTLQSIKQFPVFAVAPSGLFGYVPTGEGIVTVSLNPQSGALTSVPPILPAISLTPLVIGPSGTFAASLTDQGLTTYQLNAQTGAVSPVTPIKSSGSYGGAAIEPTGRFLYTLATNEIAVFAIDSSGAITPVPGGVLPTGANWTPQDLHISPTGAYLYALLWNEADSYSQINVYAIDAGTGTLTQTSAPPLPTGGGHSEIMAFDPSGTYVYVDNSPSSIEDWQYQVLGYSIDAATGALVPLPSNPQPAYVNTHPAAMIVTP